MTLSIEAADAKWVERRFSAPKVDLARSAEIWKIKADGVPVLVVGVIRKDLVGWAEVWAIVTDGLQYHRWSTLRAGRQLSTAARQRYAGLIAHTKPGRDERFAKFFGFREVARTGDWVRFTL